MIRRLYIKNLILIKEATIEFGPELNILTGETGSGKSAVLSAIQLLLGRKAEKDLIRQGADLAIVEAEVGNFFIRREIHRSGRSRSFINEELASLSDLSNIPIELVDQNASWELTKPQLQRSILDLFADVSLPVNEFKDWKEWQEKIFYLTEQNKLFKQKMQSVSDDLEWIDEINWKEGEEEALNDEYISLTSFADTKALINEVTQSLSELTSPLKRYYQKLERHSSLVECAKEIKTAETLLNESLYFLQSYQHKLEEDPRKILFIEKRLQDIASLRRRFGSYNEMIQFKEENRKNLDLETEIEIAKNKLDLSEKALKAKTDEITIKRTQAATALSKNVNNELSSLNLGGAHFKIDISEKACGEDGCDKVQFLFSANPGSPLIPISEGASGGEISRVLFALKTVLSSKDKSCCLIFDEIDSNVGGKTASILGEKLKKISEKKQIICITHFVQVAKFATDHFLVSKQTSDLDSITFVKKIEGNDKDKEYIRMTGGL
jgi:DNA repair protein RecN (Recombination protein N)